MIIYIVAFSVFVLFMLILLTAACIPKYRKMAKSKIKDIKDETLYNNATKSLNVSWIKTTITGG